MSLNAESQLVCQCPPEAATEEERNGADKELAHEKHHDQHEVLQLRQRERERE